MKKSLWALIFIFSLGIACQDRIFDNPFDPNKTDIGYEIVSIVPIELIIIADITFSGDALWILDSQSQVIAVDYNSGQVIRTLEVNANENFNGIGYDGNDLWLLISQKNQIIKVNMINGEIIKYLNLREGNYQFVDIFENEIYILDHSSYSIKKINSQTGQTLKTISTPTLNVSGFAFDGQNFWILDSSALKLFCLDENGQIKSVYLPPGKSPVGLCFAKPFLWCGDRVGKIYKLRFQ